MNRPALHWGLGGLAWALPALIWLALDRGNPVPHVMLLAGVGGAAAAALAAALAFLRQAGTKGRQHGPTRR